MALHCAYHTTNFEEGILKIINLCGDADSTAAILGQILGCLYGMKDIPKEAIDLVG